MRARLLADFSIVLMLSVLYLFLIVRGDCFFKSLLTYWNECSTYLVLQFVFLHLPLASWSLDIFQG